MQPLFCSYLNFMKLLLCDVIKTKSWRPLNRCKSISFHQFNVNGLLALHREKFHVVKTFVVSINNGIFCVSDTFMDSSVDNILDELNISGYTLVPFYTKCGCVAIYYND